MEPFLAFIGGLTLCLGALALLGLAVGAGLAIMQERAKRELENEGRNDG